MSYEEKFRTNEQLAEFDHDILLKAAIYYRDNLIKLMHKQHEHKNEIKERNLYISKMEEKNHEYKEIIKDLRNKLRGYAETGFRPKIDYTAISDKARAMIIKEKSKKYDK